MKLSSLPISARIAAATLAALVLIALTAPIIFPDPNVQSLAARFLPPGTDGHLLGTDGLGRDLLARIVWGSRTSLVIAACGACASILVGAIVAFAASFGSKPVRFAMERLVDVQLAFPYILLAIVLASVIEVTVASLILLMVIGGWATVSRILRSVLLGELDKDYIKAARAIGAPRLWIIRRYLAASLVPIVLSLFPLQMSAMIVSESTLSFLGLGLAPPTSSWGLIMLEGKAYLGNAWWISTLPGVAIAITAGALLILGQGLEAAIENRRRGRAVNSDGLNKELTNAEPVESLPVAIDKEAVLSVQNLTVRFDPHEAPVVSDMSFVVKAGECVGLLGESGSGKSMTLLALLGLVPPGGITTGDVRVDDISVLGLSERELRRFRGDQVAMVFQDPATALNPLRRVGSQITDVLKTHGMNDPSERRQRALQVLREAGIPDPEARARAFPFQLSGGLKQRAAIALALSCHPTVLLADEPTTNLDVSVQDQVLELLNQRKCSERFGMVFVSHDLGVISKVADRVMVMYGGQVVEAGTMREILTSPVHPYTRGLLEAAPTMDMRRSRRLRPIAGDVAVKRAAGGCPFASRCPAIGEGSCQPLKPRWHSISDSHVVLCADPKILTQKELTTHATDT